MPITPPPAIINDSGILSSERSPVLSTTPSSSIPGTGRVAGREPVATITESASIFSCAPPLFSTDSSPGDSNSASPSTRRIPLLRRRVATPSTRWPTTALFRSISAFQSSGPTSNVRPWSRPSPAAERREAACNSTLVGMHPTFRQTPPSAPFSITVTSAPNCAARIAAT